MILDGVLQLAPDFLLPDLKWTTGDNPPDFLAIALNGQRFGLELTEWLHPEQTRLSINRQNVRLKLRLALEPFVKEYRPKHFGSLTICPLFSRQLYREPPLKPRPEPGLAAAFRYEFRKFIHEMDTPMLEEYGWQFLVRDFSRYQLLRQHILDVVFTAKTTLPEHWIHFVSEGGAYDPTSATTGLLHCIQNKTKKYDDGLCTRQNLSELILLVHYGVRGLIHNTPFRWMNEKASDLEIIQRIANAELIVNSGQFQRVFLYFAFNEGTLLQLYP